MERETSPVLGSILKYLAASSSVKEIKRFYLHDTGAVSKAFTKICMLTLALLV